MPKKHEEEHENHERWLVSYADFITLLFAFFTVLYATSQKDISKALEFQKSIQRAFRSFLDFGGTQGKYVDTRDATQVLPPPIDVVPAEGTGPQETEDYVERKLEESFGDEDGRHLWDLQTDAAGLHVILQSATLFDPGSALIKQEAVSSLDKIAQVLLKMKRPLIVEGHTDNAPEHSSQFASNWELSAVRACTVVRFFIVRHNYPAKLLSAVGYADQRPRADNSTPEGRAKNRRIEILMVNQKAKQE